ncbi:hypothetical protein [Effusibacillus consociatus]
MFDFRVKKVSLHANDGEIWGMGIAAGKWAVSPFVSCDSYQLVGGLAAVKQDIRPSFWSEFVTGISAVTANKSVLYVFLLEFGWCTGGGAINVLISVMAHQVHGQGSTGAGVSYASIGAGTIIDSLMPEGVFRARSGSCKWRQGLRFLWMPYFISCLPPAHRPFLLI